MNNIAKLLTPLTLAFSLILVACSGTDSSDSASGSSNTGVRGSKAKMALIGDYLYTISGSELQLFDVSMPAQPTTFAKVPVANDIETLYPFQNNLFIGGANGVYIYDNTNPSSPQYISEFTHARAQDPVVAIENVAYVTLSDNPSEGIFSENVLDVLDVGDIYNPILAAQLPMQQPTGLSVAESSLYVCDGRAGLKRFDISERLNPKFVDSMSSVNCNDVIAHNNIVYAITHNEIKQFDYSVSPPALISTVASDN